MRPTLELTRGTWRAESGETRPRLRITARAVDSLPSGASGDDAPIGPDAATTLDARFDGKKWLVRGAATLSAAGPVLSVSGSMLASRELPELFDITVLLVARPWPEAIREAIPHCAGRPSRRTLVVSAAGLLDGGKTWIDGPLAHLLPDGRIATLVPEGADAASRGGGTSLTLVPSLWESPEVEPEGVTVEIAEASRGPLPQRARRCAAAHVVAIAESRKAELVLDSFDERAALALALLRPHFAERTVPLYCAARVADVPAAWRRFAEHTGYALTHATGRPGLATSELTAGIPEFLTVELRGAVNSPSDVIPPSLR